MQKFIIGDDDFGVGEIIYEIDRKNSIISDLTIVGDQNTFDSLSDSINDKWNWTLNPPEFYLRQIPFKLNEGYIQAIINQDTPLDKYEVALYFMEHNYIEGTFRIDRNDIFFFDGFVNIFNEKMKLELGVNLNSKI